MSSCSGLCGLGGSAALGGCAAAGCAPPAGSGPSLRNAFGGGFRAVSSLPKWHEIYIKLQYVVFAKFSFNF